MPIKTIVLYTADPWDSAMCVLRLRGPARQAGIEVIQGNQGNQISPERVSEADVVVIQRDFPRFPAYEAVVAQARKEKKLVIHEVDDLILEVPPYHVSRPAYIDVLFRILRGVVNADAVVTSTELLRGYFAQFNPNTWVVPNFLEDTLWTMKPPVLTDQNRKPVVVGYMGGGSHLPDLEMIKPVILRLLSDYRFRIVFRFWGVKPPAEFLGYPNVEWHSLDMLNYAEFARYFSQQACDLFLAPLLDNFFNQCKSQIKYLEYSALGIVGVYSQLEPYTSAITHNENGLLATSLEEWEACLHRLIDSPDLRLRLALRAQDVVRQNWLLSARYPDWLAVYEQIMQQPSIINPNRAESILAVLRIAEQVEKRQAELQMQLANLSKPIHVKPTTDQSLVGKLARRANLIYHKIRAK